MQSPAHTGKSQEPSKTSEEISAARLIGWRGKFSNIILAAIPVSGILYLLKVNNFFGVAIYMQQYLALVFGLIIASAFLMIPVHKSQADRALPWYDLVCALLAMVVGLYVVIDYKDIAIDAGIITPFRVALACVTVVLVMEASRRVVGWAFLTIIVVFLIYCQVCSYLPGDFALKSIPWRSLANYLYLDPQGVLGIPLQVSVTIVMVFVIFGQMLSIAGAGQIFIDLAFSLMGRYRGGPAKVAVIASSLFGSISGSAVANVATTGVFTIPLMKQAGYRPYFAGAVEAVASTGGQIMPPIMGAAAFLMATFLDISYAEVALAALVPAVLYYLAVLIQIDLRAARNDLVGLPKSKIPHLSVVIKVGWFQASPFILLIIALFGMNLEPTDAGLLSALFTLAPCLILNKRIGFTWKSLPKMLVKSGRGLLEVGVASAGAGLIIGVLSITGLGFIFSQILVSLAQGSVLLMLVMAALGSAILGMGMTVTAAYLLMVVLIAPALVDMGIPGLLAHLFVFYFAVLSFLTPPVGLAAYAAASIAGSRMMQTALQSMRLAIVAYIVPFIFAYHPALLLQGSFLEVLEGFGGAVVGVCLLSVAMEGYLFLKLNIPKRVLFALCGLLTMIPGPILTLSGVALALPLLVFEWKRRYKNKAISHIV